MSHITLQIMSPALDVTVQVRLSPQLTVARAARSCIRALRREYPALVGPLEDEAALALCDQTFEDVRSILAPQVTLQELLDARLIQDDAILCVV